MSEACINFCIVRSCKFKVYISLYTETQILSCKTTILETVLASPRFNHSVSLTSTITLAIRDPELLVKGA